MSPSIPPVEHGECRDRARLNRELALDAALTPDVAAAHIAIAEAYERRAGTSPDDARPGDPCGILYAIGPDGRSAICDGTLDCYVDVHGKVPGCHCHISPPCGACLEAPLACATCLETVP